MAAAMLHKRDETVQQRILPITHYEEEEYQLRSFVLVTACSIHLMSNDTDAAVD